MKTIRGNKVGAVTTVDVIGRRKLISKISFSELLSFQEQCTFCLPRRADASAQHRCSYGWVGQRAKSLGYELARANCKGVTDVRFLVTTIEINDCNEKSSWFSDLLDGGMLGTIASPTSRRLQFGVF